MPTPHGRTHFARTVGVGGRSQRKKGEKPRVVGGGSTKRDNFYSC